MTGAADCSEVAVVPAEVWRHRLDASEHVDGVGTWEWLSVSDRQWWSDNLYRMFGLEPAEISPTGRFMLERTHPDDRERVARYLRLTRRIAISPPIEYRIELPERGVRFLRLTMTTFESGARGAKRMVGTVQDVSEMRLADHEIAARVAVSAVLADWDGFEVDGKRLLGELAEAMDFAFGALWLPAGDLLSAHVVWSDSAMLTTPDFDEATRELRIPRSGNLPGLVWESRLPVGIDDVVSDRSYRRRQAAALAGLHGAVAFPVIHSGDVLAVLEFYYREEAVLTPRLTYTLGAIGSELGEFLSHRLSELHPPLLTPREVEALRLVADGYTGSEIAARLSISPATVATHMGHIYERLGVSNRAAAVAVAIRSGAID
jgi:DNA-binding CsgD family transcriptional regulator